MCDVQSRGPDAPLTSKFSLGGSGGFVRAAFPVALIAVVVTIVDQFSKTWAEGERLTYPGIHLFGDVRLARTYNEGVAFGLGGGAAPILFVVVMFGLALILFKRQLPINGRVLTGLGLVLGGGFSNLADRLFRGHGGAVVDFIDVGTLPLIQRDWPVFNIADICITAGALLIAFFGTSGGKIESAEGRESTNED